ncbi:MAG: DCC1-like thiol-disulfide oxidoreductase family protein [Vicinamibacterales bacterium]
MLFDGTCGFCEGSVRFIARRDPAGYFHFAPSQWPVARRLLEARGIAPAAARSLVLIEGDQVYLRSTASLRIAARLTRPWRWASLLLRVPRPVRDGAYAVVAAVRHRLAGRSTACEIPPPELRARLVGEPASPAPPGPSADPHARPAASRPSEAP